MTGKEEIEKVLVHLNIKIDLTEDNDIAIESTVKVNLNGSNDLSKVTHALCGLYISNPKFFDMIDFSVMAFKKAITERPDLIESLKEEIATKGTSINFGKNHK